MGNEKEDTSMKMLTFALMIVIAVATPIIAVTLASSNGKDAKETATKALDLAEGNARDFAFFKGQVMTNLEGLNKAMDKVDSKQDKVITIMSGFMRNDDNVNK